MPRKNKTSTLHYIPTTDVDLNMRAAIEQILIDECARVGIPPADAQRLVLRVGQQIFEVVTGQ